jgi:DNA-binding winged helix-turn-helix (wHTH) protein
MLQNPKPENERRTKRVRDYTNPFIINSPIEDPKLSVVRKRELGEIYRNVFGSLEPQSLAIYGPRRIGKSSLLHFLRSREAKAYFNELSPGGSPSDETDRINQSVYVIVDLRGLSRYRNEDFVTAFWRELALRGIEAVKTQASKVFETLPDEMQKGLQTDDQTRTAEEWEEHLHQLIELTSETDTDEPGLFFIFGLDHGELIFERGESGGAQVSHTLAMFRYDYRNHLVYISVVPESLDRMENRFKIWETHPQSPFYTGVPQVYIGLLPSETEAREVIGKPLEKVNAVDFFTQPEMDWLLVSGGRHPYLLSVLAHTLFNYKVSQGLDEVELGDEELRRHVDHAVSHFLRRVWQELKTIRGDRPASEEGFTRAQKAVIRIACQMELEPVIDQHLLEDLRECGVIQVNEGRPTLFAGVFADFVIREITKVKPLDFEPEVGEFGDARNRMRSIRVNGQEAEVTAREYKILRLLSQRPGKPIPFQKIAEVGEIQGDIDKQVRVGISRLRKRLSGLPEYPFKLEIVAFPEGYGLRYYIQESEQKPAEAAANQK